MNISLPRAQSDWGQELHAPSRAAIVIAGAGPIGLAAANLLGMAGIDTLIIERNGTLSDCSKAISLDDEGLRICQAMGLGAEVSESVLQNVSVDYVSGKRLLAHVAPVSRRNGYPLVSTFFQPEFEAILLDGLKRFPHVRVCFGHTVKSFTQDENGVTIMVHAPDGGRQTVHSQYLLGCDGGRSTIRHTLDIPMRGASYPQRWLVVDCIADEQRAKCITFYCNPRRPTVSVPFPHNGMRWEFMLHPDESEELLLRPERAAALIREAGGSSMPRIIRQTVYTFQAAQAVAFGKRRAFLLGDAAHMMPPFGGQGLNSGLRDAHNLAWKLALVLRGLAHPRLLDSYHTERAAHVAQMTRLSSFLAHVVMTRAHPLAFARDQLFRATNTLPALRVSFTEAKIKPQPRYRHGFFLPGQTGRTMTGQLLPQPILLTGQGQSIPLDDLLDDSFAILRLSNTTPRDAFAALDHGIWQRLNTCYVCIPPDADAAFSHLLHDDRDLFVVVRPDRYVLGTFQEHEARGFAERFEKILQDGL